MYEARFSAVSGSDWAEIIEAVRADNGLPLTDIDTALIELEVRDRCGFPMLRVSTDDGTITRPSPGKFQWVISKDRLSGLCVGMTYGVGVRVTTDGGTIPLIVGSLAYIDGEIK